MTQFRIDRDGTNVFIFCPILDHEIWNCRFRFPFQQFMLFVRIPTHNDTTFTTLVSVLIYGVLTRIDVPMFDSL